MASRHGQRGWESEVAQRAVQVGQAALFVLWARVLWRVLGGELDVGRGGTCALVFLHHLRRFSVNMYVEIWIKQQTFHLVLHFNDICHPPPDSAANPATRSSNSSSNSESNSDGEAPMTGGKRASKYVSKHAHYYINLLRRDFNEEYTFWYPRELSSKHVS